MNIELREYETLYALHQVRFFNDMCHLCKFLSACNSSGKGDKSPSSSFRALPFLRHILVHDQQFNIFTKFILFATCNREAMQAKQKSHVKCNNVTKST